MKTYARFLFILSIAILFRCAPASMTDGELPEYETYVKTDIPDNVNLWKRSVIHIECASNVETVRHRIQLNPDEISTIWEQFNWGSALYLIHHEHRFILTSRTLLHDTTAARLIMKKARAAVQPEWSEAIKRHFLQEADARSQRAIYPLVFKVPSMEEFQTPTSKASTIFLIGLGEIPQQMATYTFSSPDIDLAVISLDQQHADFANSLESAGIKPVSSQLFGIYPEDAQGELWTVGYPLAPHLQKKLGLPRQEDFWRAGFTSVPTIAFGSLTFLDDDMPFFMCNFPHFPGDVGGPVIQDNRLVGIISQVTRKESSDFVAMAVKAREIHSLLALQEKKDRLYREWIQDLEQL